MRTVQQYCQKTENSTKKLIWEFNNGQRHDSENIEAVDLFAFSRFQQCAVLKVTNRAAFDIVKVDCDFDSTFKVVPNEKV